MAFTLRNDLHWCNCDGRAVFLDALEDRYFLLPAAANDAFLRAAAREIGPGDRERLNRLVERGLLIHGDADAIIRPPPAIATPTHDLLEQSTRRARLPIVVRALLAEVRAARNLRTKPFQMVIGDGRARRLKSQPTHWKARRLQRIAAAAAAVSLITRSHDRCLVRALAVHSLCRSSGIRANLTFGVVAHPFTAHCWVQVENAVLVGGYEQARLHTPILVLE